jgi:hypothetical protein
VACLSLFYIFCGGKRKWRKKETHFNKISESQQHTNHEHERRCIKLISIKVRRSYRQASNMILKIRKPVTSIRETPLSLVT